MHVDRMRWRQCLETSRKVEQGRTFQLKLYFKKGDTPFVGQPIMRGNSGVKGRMKSVEVFPFRDQTRFFKKKRLKGGGLREERGHRQ